LHLPDGYLRKLSNAAAIGHAMDRLYREVRLGIITTEMGRVLFNILTRLMDSDLIKSGPCPQRTRAARIRPRLADLLTREERAAWRNAVDNAPSPSPYISHKTKSGAPSGRPVKQQRQEIEHPAPGVLQAVS
jgi:hypothetical protein